MNYNKDLARKYFNEATTMGKSKENRLKDMKEKVGIEIKYDLRGLYDKFPGDELDSKSVNVFSLEERKFLLDNANKAKDNGFGECKKGLKVKIFEKLDQFRNRFTKQNLLTMGKVKDYSEEKSSKEEMEGLSDKDKKKLKRLIKIKTKEVVNEPYGLQQDVLDKLEEINDPYPEEVRKEREKQRKLKDRVQVDDETKKNLDEVVEQYKEEEIEAEQHKEEKSEQPHRLTPDENEVIEFGSER